jgi:hypothetical protein
VVQKPPSKTAVAHVSAMKLKYEVSPSSDTVNTANRSMAPDVSENSVRMLEFDILIEQEIGEISDYDSQGAV